MFCGIFALISPDTAHHLLPQRHLWHAVEANVPPQYSEKAAAERLPHELVPLPAHLHTTSLLRVLPDDTEQAIDKATSIHVMQHAAKQEELRANTGL